MHMKPLALIIHSISHMKFRVIQIKTFFKLSIIPRSKLILLVIPVYQIVYQIYVSVKQCFAML